MSLNIPKCVLLLFSKYGVCLVINSGITWMINFLFSSSCGGGCVSILYSGVSRKGGGKGWFWWEKGREGMGNKKMICVSVDGVKYLLGGLRIQ